MCVCMCVYVCVCVCVCVCVRAYARARARERDSTNEDFSSVVKGDEAPFILLSRLVLAKPTFFSLFRGVFVASFWISMCRGSFKR